MRRIILLFILPINICLAKANAIDRLRTNRDVEAFASRVLKEHHLNEFPPLRFIPTDSVKSQNLSDSVVSRWKGRCWQKADLNGDGRTDLLFILYHQHTFNSFIVMDDGRQGFEVHHLSKSLFWRTRELIDLTTISEQPVILFHYQKQQITRRPHQVIDKPQTDTLVYKFDNFVEYNPAPVPVQLLNINCSTSPCFGSCPVFELTIKSNGKATYINYNNTTNEQIFTGNIVANKLKQITDLLGYINIRQLKDNYAVNWTDDQTVNLTITFADGSSKTIKDYGMRGTFGLSRLYELLFDLRISQTWE